MCMNLKRISEFCCLAVGVVLLLCAYLFFFGDVFYSIPGVLGRKDFSNTGELVAGVSLRQIVYTSTGQILDEERSNLPLCVEILLANYNDRENHGTIMLGVDLDGRIERREIDAATVKDNAYHRICFENVTLRDVYDAEDVFLLLEGVDSGPGSAVTAWTTSESRYGTLVTTEDHLKDRSLVFRLGHLEHPKFVSLFPADLEQNDSLPVGELVADVRLRHDVNLDTGHTPDEERSNMPLCVEILLANYNDRENHGTIMFGIDLDGRIERREIDAAMVKDNAYHRVCFVNVTLRDVYDAEDVFLLLEGVDSEPGSAVTAWTTSDARYGALAATEDHLKDRSLVFRLGHLDHPKLVSFLPVDLEHKDSIPVGELVADVCLRQDVNLDAKRTPDEERSNQPLCVEILLANYNNRKNHGTIMLGIDLDGRIERREIDAAMVKDNAYHRICFENVTLKDVFDAKELFLLLEGVDSEPGSAVTAWTTSEVRYGTLVTTEDDLKNQSLVFHLGYKTSSLNHTALILVLIAALSITTLISFFEEI